MKEFPANLLMGLAWFFRSLEQGAWEAAEQHPRLAIPVTLRFACEELGSVAELFLTSTTAKVLPLVTLDGKPVGDGKPGPITCKLRDGFEAWERADRLKTPSVAGLNSGEV